MHGYRPRCTVWNLFSLRSEVHKFRAGEAVTVSRILKVLAVCSRIRNRDVVSTWHAFLVILGELEEIGAEQQVVHDEKAGVV